MVRGLVVLLLFSILAVAVSAEPVVFEDLQEGFTPTESQPTYRLDMPMAPSTFGKAEVELDVTWGPLYDDEFGGHFHNILWLQRGVGDTWQEDVLGFVNLVNGAKARVTHGLDTATSGQTGANVGYQQGKTSHIRYVYDSSAGTITLFADGQQVFSDTQGVAQIISSVSAKGVPPGFFIKLGNPDHAQMSQCGDPEIEDKCGPEVPSYGWTYSNLKVSFHTSNGSTPNVTGPATLTPASGFIPDDSGDGEPTPLIDPKEGLFFEQPFNGQCADGSACQSTLSIDIPSLEAHEKIIVKFDFDTHDLLQPGFYQHLLRMSSACSGKQWFNLALKQPYGNTPAKTVLVPRGTSNQLSGDGGYEEFSRYSAEVVIDLLDEEAYVTILDGQGNKMHTVGQKINSDPGNLATIEQTQDGFRLHFGLEQSDRSRIYGQPHFWKFYDLEVLGVPFGSGTGGSGASGPNGPDFDSDAGRLAFLAAQMISTADGGDYSLECGPHKEALNVPPSQGHANYACVLKTNEGVAFGLFGEDESLILDSLKDPQYEAHVGGEGIDSTACSSIPAGEEGFEECTDAIRGMKTYAMIDPFSESSFVVVSRERITAWDPGIFDSITGFFQSLFGISNDPASVAGLPLRRFHHGYFAQEQGREVAAAWHDAQARLIYKGFVSDIGKNRPAGSEYYLGSDKQILTLDLTEDSAADVRLWRSLTSSLRLGEVPGEPVQGDYCGNGLIGFEEQCEPSLPVGSCEDLYPGAGSQAAQCFPAGHENECMIDVQGCLGEKDGACWDDPWVQPPQPNPCPGDPACVSGGGGGGDPGDSGGDGGPEDDVCDPELEACEVEGSACPSDPTKSIFGESCSIAADCCSDYPLSCSGGTCRFSIGGGDRSKPRGPWDY